MTIQNLKKLFSVSPVINSINIELPDHDPYVPSVDPNYVFDKDLLNQVLLYLNDPLNDCLFISGPSGCGKTSIIMQIAARLKWPVQSITCSAKTESQDLIGHTTIKDGALTFVYGALVNAMLNGHILLINEIDLMPPSDLTALNDVLDGKPLTIVQNNGEVIRPHKNFRVIVTANTKGSGDDLGQYIGTRVLNKAFLDRFRFVDASYPDKEAEHKILKTAYPLLSDTVASCIIKLAAEIRGLMSDDADATSIDTPFTTRSLLRIGGIACNYPKISMLKAVDMGYASRLAPVEREFIKRLTLDIFGNKADKIFYYSVIQD